MPLSTVTGRQIKAGRALLGWKRDDLARRSGMKALDVRTVEAAPDLPASVPDALSGMRERLAAALHSAGIEFTNGGALGVALHPRSEGLRPEDLNASNDD